MPPVLNGSLGEILAYLARARAGGFTSNRTLMLHRGHTVSKLNSRPQTLPSSFLQLGHRTSLRLASFFRSNQVRLALSLLAYNLGNLWRRLALPKRIENWFLTSLQQRLVKTGGQLVKHARHYWLLLA